MTYARQAGETILMVIKHFYKFQLKDIFSFGW